MSDSNDGSPGKVLEIKTVQIAPFRVLMTVLKDILLETNISFQPDGIRIINMDKSHTILAHLYLNSNNFEVYNCAREKIVIGVNMFHLFKLINTIDNDDTLTLYIEESHYTDGIVQHLGLKFENGDIKQMKIQKLKLIEPDEEELDMPSVKFSSIINLPATDFQKIRPRRIYRTKLGPFQDLVLIRTKVQFIGPINVTVYPTTQTCNRNIKVEGRD